ncbi:MAG: hypothetical protein JNL80_08100 [Phycisphaerae bacterium]|jgi:tetratricopeptide (TPR) repeat protein|nr:hypothetical protein [Phycisphaerae bacterium]
MTGRFSRLEFGDDKRSHDERREPTVAGALRPTEALDLYGTPKRDAKHFLMLAVDSQRTGHHETALQHFTRAVREDRTTVPAWVGQVQMLVELREYAEARLWADKALELFRDNGDLLAAKAQACLRQGDTVTALAASDVSLKSSGSSAWRWAVRGEVMLSRGEAIFRNCLQKALAEPGADWFDRTLMATMGLFHGKAAWALEYAQQGVASQPNAPFAWLVLGRCQQALGWSEQAHETYRRCLELTPRLEEAVKAMDGIERESSGSRLLRRIRSWLRSR